MAEQNPPNFLQTRDHPSVGLRRWAEAITFGTTGVLGDDSLKVTADSGLDVSIAEGSAILPGSISAQQGTYFVDAWGATIVSLSGANSDPRIDLIVAVVYDSIYAGSEPNDGWELTAITGTPATSPAVPALPDNAIALAQVSVPANATSVGTITDVRPYAERPGEQIYATTAERDLRIATPRNGQQVYITGEERHYFYDGTEWKTLWPKITRSTSTPSGGEPGDLWLVIDS